MNYIEENLPYESFIGGWYIDKNVCDDMVDYHKSNKQLHFQGRAANEVNKDRKDSIDVTINLADCDDKQLFKDYKKILYDLISLYEEKYIEYKDCKPYGLVENFPIQYYPPGGGFKQWHCERFSHSNRNLVFMTYLTDVDNAGTEFKYQKLKTECKKGLTLIWPTDITHTHRGIINNKHEKYIVTGWFGYV